MGESSQQIWKLFDIQCFSTPDHIALYYKEKQYTYRWVQKEAKRIMELLSHAGVSQREVVVISLSRNPYLFSCLLACIAQNTVFLLVEPSQPINRIQELLSLVQPALVLHDNVLNSQKLRRYKLVNIFSSLSSLPLSRVKLCKLQCPEPDIMYIIFTSGSTGRPKPILASTSGTLNRFQWMWNTYPFTNDDKVCFKTSIHFVDCIWELLGGILQGVPTVILNSEDVTTPLKFLSLVKSYRITRLSLVPTYLSVLLSLPEAASYLCSLHILVSSGETLSIYLAKQFLSKVPRCRLLNLYGSSEVCADVTCYEVTDSNIIEMKLEPSPLSSVPIGWPISNIHININDIDKGIGELAVSGVGVGHGYLHVDANTCGKFAFNELRTFKTGDLVRTLSSGALVYMGRTDNQIKVRGIRIEPTEVEDALLQCSIVQKALVCSYQEKNTLVAYIQTSFMLSSAPIQHKDHLYYLDTYLTARINASLNIVLPPYLLPSLLIFTSNLPTLSSGKINKHALPLPSEVLQAQCDNGKPDSSLVKQVSRIFSDLLGEQNITHRSNFFHLGGQSLLAVRLVHSIQSLGYSIPYSAVFTHQTVSSMVEYITQHGKPITNINKCRPVAMNAQIGPLSYQQHGIWMSQTLHPSSTAHNVELAYISTQPLSIERLRECVYHIISQHEALRTVFPITARGEPQQHVLDWDSPELQAWLPELVSVKDSSSLGWSNGEVILPHVVFNMKEGPLFRITVYSNITIPHLSGSVILSVQIHHLITDGWSMKTMLEQLESMYVNGVSSSSPNTKAVSLLSYALHQRDSKTQEGLYKDKLSYWRNKLSGMSRRSSIPHDKIRPPIPSNAAGSIRRRFDVPLLTLSQFCFKHQVTEFMVLLATLKVTLNLLGASNDINVAVAEANRYDDNTSNTLGVFVVMLIMRSDLSRMTGFSSFLSRVRQTVLDAFDNSLPMEYLEEQLNPRLDPYTHSFYQVMMVFQREEEQPFTSSSLFSVLPVQGSGYECDLDIYVAQSSLAHNRLSVEIRYPSEIYYTSTIHNFVESWNTVLHRVVTNTNLYVPSILGMGPVRSTPLPLPIVPNDVSRDGIAIATFNKNVTWSMISSISRGIQELMKTHSITEWGIISVQLDSVAMSAAVGMACILCGMGVIFPEYSTITTDISLSIVEYTQPDSPFNAISITQLLETQGRCEPVPLRGKLHGVIHDSSIQWMSQYDIATVGEFIHKYVNGKSNETVHVLATSLNSSQFSLVLALLINHITVHLHITLNTITHSNISLLLLPTDSIYSAITLINTVQPQILWFHGFPSGLRYIIENIKARTYISHSILSSHYVVTHHYAVSNVKDIVNETTRYLPLGNISSYITWKLINMDGNPTMKGGLGSLVFTSEGLEICSRYLVRHNDSVGFELVSMNFSSENDDNTLTFTALCKHPDIVWSALEPDLLLYTTTSELFPPHTLKKYLLKYVPTHLIPSNIQQVNPISSLVTHDQTMPSSISDTTSSIHCPIYNIVINTVQELLGLREIEQWKSFHSLGGHSLLAMQLAMLLSQHLSLQVDIRLVFESKSIYHLIKTIHILFHQNPATNDKLTCNCT